MYKSPLHTINGPSFFLPDHICYCVPQNPIVRDNNRQEEEEKSLEKEKRKILHTQTTIHVEPKGHEGLSTFFDFMLSVSALVDDDEQKL